MTLERKFNLGILKSALRNKELAVLTLSVAAFTGDIVLLFGFMYLSAQRDGCHQACVSVACPAEPSSPSRGSLDYRP